MYRYDEIDATLVAERVAQFRDQTRRFLDGKQGSYRFLTLDEKARKRVRCPVSAERFSTTQRSGPGMMGA